MNHIQIHKGIAFYETMFFPFGFTRRTVYKCIDANNNIECCVKRIKLIETTNMAVANTHFDMIQQEIYLLQHLIHPRIIHLYDYFYSNDNAFVFIVMELAAFGPLSKMIAHRRTQLDFFQEVVSSTVCVCAVCVKWTWNCNNIRIILFHSCFFLSSSIENQKHAHWHGAWHRIFTYEKCGP